MPTKPLLVRPLRSQQAAGHGGLLAKKPITEMFENETIHEI
jgi:hypothetical protein